MNEQEFINLKKWVDKFFKEHQKGSDLFDLNAECDKDLSLAENKTIIREKLRLFFNDYQRENLKKKEAEIINKDKYQLIIQEAKYKAEEQAQLEFNNSLKEISGRKETDLLNQKFFLLRQYVKMVCKGNINGLIVEGEAGLGKSFNVLKTLSESGKEFIYCSGYSTTLELYNFLYENRYKIIFFDDTKNIFKNEASLEILKAVLFSPAGIRIVRYNSNTTKLKAPSSFIFEGGLIIAINELNNKQNEDLKAVIDRVLFFKVSFSYKEKLQILADLMKLDYKELSQDDRNFIFSFIKDNTSEATINLNFRLLYKLYEIYRFNKQDFRQMAINIIKKDEHKELILTLIKKNATIKQAEHEFLEITGLSRRTFYNLKKTI